jgi:hypothetical protein
MVRIALRCFHLESPVNTFFKCDLSSLLLQGGAVGVVSTGPAPDHYRDGTSTMAKHHTITINAAVIVGGLMLGGGQSFAQIIPSQADIYGQANQHVFDSGQSRLDEQRQRQNEQMWREKDALPPVYSQQGTWPSGQPYPPGTAPGVTLSAPINPNPSPFVILGR